MIPSRLIYRQIPRSIISPTIRYNSTTTTAQPVKKVESNYFLTQIYPISETEITDKDLDSWIEAVKNLKQGKKIFDTKEEIYLNQIVNNSEEYLKKSFEPSLKQIEESKKYADKAIPLMNDPIVDNLVNLIMRHGKKNLARKVVNRAFFIIQMKLRKDPIEIFKETLDKLGPVVKTRSMSTGFAKKKIVPQPMTERQRNRFAITWILEASKSRKSNDFSVRLAEEIINAYMGKSSGYDKKAQMHKLATQQRAYIQL
ncbi:unnamed protein product [Candida verbasci]|uniref:Small ribosomal subunit protein uS7m n=1 Tax=Candida verbasci TaxID=1227364 RepID=A0A9W4XBT3_9ASCO|nr:unnamed protein product [Candida verbasci]